jgi:outer membrane receptor for ferrienterochelin and colicins
MFASKPAVEPVLARSPSFRGGLASLSITLCLLAVPVLASEQDDQELAALLATLDAETAVATRTRMNRDFVPGMVSVFEGAHLRALGVRTLGEAMAHVPGVQAAYDARGNPTVTARGIQIPFNAGSIQIMVDGYPLAREDIGVNGALLALPMEHVERIEFVRGPGSVLYGDFAFQGLLNVLTRSTGREFTVSIGSGERQAHGLLSGELGDWQWSASMAALSSDNVILPRPREASERRHSGVIRLEGGGTLLQVMAHERDIGRVTGGPPDPGYRDAAWSFVGEQRWSLGPDLGLRLHGQWLDNAVDSGEQLFSVGFLGRQARFGGELEFGGLSRHGWLLGVEQTIGRIDRARLLSTFTFGQSGLPELVDIRDQRRRVSSVYLQDAIELSPQLRLTLGLRYDDNRDVDTRLTPRASLVWQPVEGHILKAQYAEGHRSPTFFELYANGNLNSGINFEVNATTELSYIWRRPHTTVRLTGYRTRLRDIIFPDLSRGSFGNIAKADAHGAELEWTALFRPTLRADLNLAWSQASDNRNLPLLQEGRIGANPAWIGQFGLHWQPAEGVDVGSSLVHVGQRPAASLGDGAYQRLDVNLRLRGIVHPQVDLEAGVDNLFNSRTVQLVTIPVGTGTFLYQDRVIWGALRWRWP